MPVEPLFNQLNDIVPMAHLHVLMAERKQSKAAEASDLAGRREVEATQFHHHSGTVSQPSKGTVVTLNPEGSLSSGTTR